MTLQDERPRTRVLLPEQPAALHRRRAPRTGRVVGAAVALAAVMLLGVASEWLGANQREPVAAPAGDLPRPQGAAPAAPESSAYPNTRVGAQSAATNYVVELGGAAMFDADRRHALVRRVADPAVEPALQQQFDAAFGAVLATFGLDERGRPPRGLTFVSRVLPVGVQLLDYTGSSARVAVWTAGIVGLAGETSTRPVAEAWSTTTVTLRWTGGDWKWVTFTQQDGPTPVSGLQPPSNARDVADAVASFGELRYAR
jgi:hypothetical protein